MREQRQDFKIKPKKSESGSLRISLKQQTMYLEKRISIAATHTQFSVFIDDRRKVVLEGPTGNFQYINLPRR